MRICWMVAAVLVAGTADAGELELDPDASRLSFVAHQAMLGDTVGRFDRVRAPVLRLDLQNLAESRIRVVVETGSVYTGNEDRDEHLRNEDFFHVERFPEMVFESSRITGSRERLRVRGNLTVKDRTVPIEIPLSLDWVRLDGRRAVHAVGEGTVSRRALGLDFDTPFYIPEIADEIRIRVDVVARAADRSD